MVEAEAPRGAAGIYPVDILEDDPEGHREAALAYYASLWGEARPSAEVFCLPTGEQVKLEASSVCFCTVHRDEPQHKILVLVNPQDTKTVVAVYIKESWWTTEDVLRTSDPAREGLMKVQSFGERIVLFILNVVIFGRLERNLDDDDMFFLPHSVKEQAKILWRDGAAVGFYTTKMKVCRKFLSARPEEQGRLWEVEPPGAWGQRGNIWRKVQLQQSRLSESHPGNSKEDVSGRGRTSQDGTPRQSTLGKAVRTGSVEKNWKKHRMIQTVE
ncbi:protein FAM169B-like isoform X4 [Diceros bicornis minor]|uniref:protein FAM169B-like isoform X4 n=1 Tax=Diceros bicornis minor TaxID=77932 RepID=UPI0026E98C7D|nr:protein FAM169B-like isoform X4 [Diceros bicornis minor]